MNKLTLPRPMPLFATVAREMEDAQNRLLRYFNEGFPLPTPLTESVGWVPAVEIVENKDEMVLTAELPGMAKENLEVLFEDDVLTIRGEKKEEKREGNGEKRIHVYERLYGAFQRTFTIPRTIDATKILAEFKDGVLTIKMPKTALAKTKSRKIEIAAK